MPFFTVLRKMPLFENQKLKIVLPFSVQVWIFPNMPSFQDSGFVLIFPSLAEAQRKLIWVEARLRLEIIEEVLLCRFNSDKDAHLNLLSPVGIALAQPKASDPTWKLEHHLC
jgi:hypothetical protein